MSREQLRQKFLDRTKYAGLVPAPLPADASFRRYFRLALDQQPALLMDAPPPQEDVRPFVRIAEHLLAMNLSAPQIYDQDTERGFLTLEDFGHATYTRLLASGADEYELYALAVDTLVALHVHPHSAAVDAPIYDAETLLTETSVFTEWFCPHFSLNLSDEVLTEFREAWRETLASMVPGTKVLVLRDYHVDNLMRLEGREGVQACGLLDFQDALLGSAAYDLVSLLEDARRDLTPGLVEDMLERYCMSMQLSHDDWAGFLSNYHVLGAQRHCRVLGVFVRLLERDGKDVYLQHLPRLARLFLAKLQQPELAPVKCWVEKHLFEVLDGLAARNEV